MPHDRLTVVIPVFNEESGLSQLARELVAVLDSIANLSWHVLFVDDGSVDGTRGAIAALHEKDSRFQAITLSRNFGKETAIAAGLRFADGDAIVLMDGDLEHPPEVIPAFVQGWRAGFKIVFGRRAAMEDRSPLRRLYSWVFYLVFHAIARTRVPAGAVDFLLMDRQAVDAMNRIGERTRFSKGLYSWVGFRTTVVEFKAGNRTFGGSRWGLRSLMRFALDGLVSFSSFPLKLASYCGFLVSAGALLYAAMFLVRTLLFGTDVAGFPSLIVSIMFFSGVQLISLGVLGEYVARIYDEVKARPLYIVDETIGLTNDSREAIRERDSAGATDLSRRRRLRH
jgi:glycosyltransferase involved in cell wall biosynthesis